MPVEDRGDGVITFTDFHEFLAWQAQKEDEANARVTDFQRKLKPGDFVFRVVEMGQHPLLVLGQTFTPQAWYADMSPKYGEEESRQEADSISERFQRGYLFGRWYSLIESQGEYGDAHISTLGPAMPVRLWHVLLEMIQKGIDPMREVSW